MLKQRQPIGQHGKHANTVIPAAYECGARLQQMPDQSEACDAACYLREADIIVEHCRVTITLQAGRAYQGTPWRYERPLTDLFGRPDEESDMARGPPLQAIPRESNRGKQPGEAEDPAKIKYELKYVDGEDAKRKPADVVEKHLPAF